MSSPPPLPTVKTGSFALAKAFWAAYPRQTAVIVAAFIAAGLMESVGVTTILPLLSVLSPGQAMPGPVDEAVAKAFAMAGMAPAVGPILCLIVALLCAKAVISYAAMSRVNHITVTIGKNLRLRLIRALLRAQWRHFPDLAVGKSANAIGTEAARAALGYMSLGKGLADSIQVFIYIMFALLISWPITLGAFIAGAGIAFMLKGLIAVSRRAGNAQTALMASILARVTDTLSGVKAIKAMGREQFFIGVLAQENEQLARAQYSEYTASQLLVIAREPILALILAAGLYIAVVHAGVPVAVLLVLAFMFFRVVSKITAMQSNFQRMASMESAYWSLTGAIAQAESVAEDLAPGGAPVPAAADIRFEDVSFSYGARTVLDRVNAVLPAKSFTAVIGPSGAGKTTFIDLLTGLQTPSSGRITVGGTPLADIDLAQWRHSIGYLPQETLLFHDTVFANIAMGDPGVTREGAEKALRAAGVWEAIAALPEGLDAMVGERGQRFSGGQRQRIAIARALARAPRLLLLDEPTSALDAETEARLLETIRGLAEYVTVIAITHNPAVAGYADNVLHIDRGRLIS